MQERAFAYIYSLIYPAILGSFFFTALTRSDWNELQVKISCLMLVYFHVLYVEGLIAGQKDDRGNFHYGFIRFWQDLLEALAILAVFASIGFFAPAPGQPPSWLDRLSGWHWAVLLVTFAIPPVGRLIRSRFGEESDMNTARGRALSVLSLLAMTGCVVGWTYCECLGLWLIALALFLYVFFFILFPKWARQELEGLRGRLPVLFERKAAPPPPPPPA